MHTTFKSIAIYFIASALLFIPSTLFGQNDTQTENDTVAKFKEALSIAAQQYKTLATNTKIGEFPRSVRDNEIRFVRNWDWTSGFFPGSLWYLYEYTEDEFFKTKAGQLNASIEQQKNNTGTHDLGFMLYCSFGNGDRLFDVQKYKDILVTASNSLISRYNANVGCIRSWDFGSWEYPVIIDNMMNLEMLFWASKHTGDSKYYDIALKHAQTTLENHFREDYSSFHVVDYKKSNGAVRSKGTHQGAGDSTAWARGQSWGLYGYTMAYRETKDEAFLSQAEKIGDFIITQLPDDYVPYWDYSLTGVAGEPRDASAGAIAASAYIELSQYSKENGGKYLKIAEEILLSLCSEEYLAEVDSNFNFILKHSTGNKPNGSEVDVPINYADYYFIEALLRYVKLKETVENDETAQDDGENNGDETSNETGDNTDEGSGDNSDEGTNDDSEDIADNETGDTTDEGAGDESTDNGSGDETTDNGNQDESDNETTGIFTAGNAHTSISHKILNGEIHISNIQGKAIIQIYDFNGRVKIVGNEGEHNINISNLPEGPYILRIIEDESIKTIKFVKHQ